MKQRLLLLLCVAMLLPSVASAQFFAKQKVAVWEIADRNNDVSVNDGTKHEIRTSIVNAFVGSRNYESFIYDKQEVLNRLKSSGQSQGRGNIAKAMGQLYGVNYVIFSTIQVLERSTSYEDFLMHLSSDLISAETGKSERMYYVDLRSDISAIPAACAKLLSGLLGEQIDVQHQVQYQQQPQQPTAQPSQTHYAHQPRTRSGVEVVFGYLRVFPSELGTFPTEPKTVIAQVNKQAMHDYDTWRLPTAEELALVRAQGLIGGGNYMTSATSASEGIVLLVTDATETYSAKYGGMGNNGVYEVGYYYNRNGKEGVVFEVTNGGRRGKIVSVVQGERSWHEAIGWYQSLGSDWYLPSRAELQSICGVREEIDKTLDEIGKITLYTLLWSRESYDDNFDCAWFVDMRDGNTYCYNKSGSLCVRAVSAF